MEWHTCTVSADIAFAADGIARSDARLVACGIAVNRRVVVDVGVHAVEGRADAGCVVGAGRAANDDVASCAERAPSRKTLKDAVTLGEALRQDAGAES